MKTYLFFLLLAGLICSSFIDKKSSEKTYYYFCTSSAWLGKHEASEKEIITYTDIHKIKCSDAAIHEKTREWGNFIEKNCSNSNGCSSDLNCYDTKEQAEKVYEQILKSVSDSGRYILKKVEFK